MFSVINREMSIEMMKETIHCESMYFFSHYAHARTRVIDSDIRFATAGCPSAGFEK